MMEASSRSFASSSAEETRAIARALGRGLLGGDTIALSGDLGSGKTTFTRGLVEGLGLDARIVSSPTYVLEHIYPTRVPVHHFDAYRLSSVEELLALGFHERLDGRRVVVVEWAEKVLPAFPPDRLLVEIEGPGAGDPSEYRKLVFSSAPGVWASRLDALSLYTPKVLARPER
ncbi:MAG TPA: tRNA (adenosine(37)-N6)-threonylcarbamoyltransferase complex ATPase subunit type 1 TsaE [Planctomycetota bacterium]|nr:tRNA (adenosine(37)-N6)-threonylcarbamoyltransferase complex ATPase subunit type 1 TsaE [Planctomycetota bacterium]